MKGEVLTDAPLAPLTPLGPCGKTDRHTDNEKTTHQKHLQTFVYVQECEGPSDPMGLGHPTQLVMEMRKDVHAQMTLSCK